MQTCPRCGEPVPAALPPPSLRCSAEVYSLLGPALARRKQERFIVVAVDSRNRIISKHLVAVGSLAACVVHPREVFAPLIRRHAAAAILVHCHPSGDPTASPDDIELTERLSMAGRLLGIEVLDHIVVGRDDYYSFRDSGRLGAAHPGTTSCRETRGVSAPSRWTSEPAQDHALAPDLRNVIAGRSASDRGRRVRV